jgi:hypothetical protein
MNYGDAGHILFPKRVAEDLGEWLFFLTVKRDQIYGSALPLCTLRLTI